MLTEKEIHTHTDRNMQISTLENNSVVTVCSNGKKFVQLYISEINIRLRQVTTSIHHVRIIITTFVKVIFHLQK